MRPWEGRKNVGWTTAAPLLGSVMQEIRERRTFALLFASGGNGLHAGLKALLAQLLDLFVDCKTFGYETTQERQRHNKSTMKQQAAHKLSMVGDCYANGACAR